MGFWDLLLFNIATVLGPRWISAAGHNGTSSIRLWLVAKLGTRFDRPAWGESYRRQLRLRGYHNSYCFWQGSSKP
jgi:hypothetical protein